MHHVDRGVMAGGGQAARENDVAVEDGAHGVADRFVEIVAFHQDGEESGDGALLKISGALQNARQQIEDRGRVALLAGRLAGGQADFALRHGQARHRIHDEQHVGALIAKIFGDGQGHETGAHAQRRGTVGGGADHHRAAAALGSHLVFQKGAHLAVALADERDHRDVGRIVPRHGAQQGALAHAAAAEDSHALAFAARA
jgi:hypothetical protein